MAYPLRATLGTRLLAIPQRITGAKRHIKKYCFVPLVPLLSAQPLALPPPKKTIPVELLRQGLV